ncbi:MAG TPA: 50S ribosomal protein L21 [Acidimicrobiia bacterium]|nr:50S ribosomal protein L21 [Acidimicrobiia bacterium]
MYAIISDGSKQYKVQEGDEVVVERLNSDSPTVTPIMIVDGDRVLAAKSDLAKAVVSVSFVRDTTGKKIDGFNYKNKSNNRKRYGHRQKYHVITIDKISA